MATSSSPGKMRGRQAGVLQAAPTWMLQGPRGAERPTCPRWDTGEGPELRRGPVLVPVVVVEARRWLCWKGSLGPLSRRSWANVCWRAEAILAWWRRS